MHRSPPAPRASSAAAWLVQFPVDQDEAANDNAWAAMDGLASDPDAWLEWLMDFVAIESAIRRRGS